MDKPEHFIFHHTTTIRVRYADTDQMAYVYYGNYARYFEIGRVEAIRSLGITYKELEQSGIGLPVTHLEIKYLRPIYYDELITIHTYIVSQPDSLIHFYSEIWNALGKRTTQGKVTLCFFDIQLKQKTQAPLLLLESLQRNQTIR